MRHSNEYVNDAYGSRTKGLMLSVYRAFCTSPQKDPAPQDIQRAGATKNRMTKK